VTEFVTHPTTGQLRVRHDSDDRGAARFLNRSLALKEIEEQKLTETPDCEQCGAPAIEIHRTDAICTISPPYDIAEWESVCRRCHDETLCTAPPVTALDWMLRFE
jgi:hypothetical protein